MKIIVLKFGGTSVGSIQRIKKVSKIIKSYSKKYRVIVLSSAISGTTNKLINMSKKISVNFPDNEFLCIDNNNKVKIQYTNELDEKKLIMFIAKKLKLNNKAFEVAKIIAIPRNKSGKKVYI